MKKQIKNPIKQHIKQIESIHNANIKQITQLHTPKGRKKLQKFIAEGHRVLDSFSRAGWVPEELYATETHVKIAKKLFPNYQNSITCTTEAVMTKISTATTPSGILAIFQLPVTTQQQKNHLKLSAGAVLAHIQDPG